MILYITDQGIKAGREGARLVLYRIKKGKEESYYEVRFDELEQIFVFGRTNFTAPAVQGLLRHNIDVHFLTISGTYLGRLAPPRGKNIDLRLAQFRCFDNDRCRCALAKAFVYGKIYNQRQFLRRQNRKFKDNELGQVILQLRQKQKELNQASNVDVLRGVEGQSAYLYFSVFGKLFQVEGLIFPGRIRRPPPDPINALLSLGYTLLCSRMLSLVETSGLDPYLGYLHSPEYGRPSLVLDLIEEWRPIIVDSLVVRLFNWGTIRPTDFVQEDLNEEEEEIVGGLKLTPDGLRKFLHHFSQRLNEEATYPPLGKRFRYRDIMQHQVWHLARVLQRKEKEYIPYTSAS